MNRKCKWCGKVYETSTGSSMFCPENPNRENNLKYRKWNASPVKIKCLPQPKRSLKHT